MRGRPARELLRQSAPLVAVAAVLVAAPTAAGGTPQPDRAPTASTTLAPDPAPGAVKPPARVRVKVAASPRPAHVVPVSPSPPTSAPASVSTKPAVHPKAKRAVVRPPVHRPRPASLPSPFLLPRIALPVLIAADPVHAPRDLDAILAGLALLLAAAAAGSGARLVAVSHRRAGP